MRTDFDSFPQRSSGLVDVLDRVLDKGLVIAGDIRVSLAEVELLTIRIRLLVCSIDKAQEIGLDWWRHDRYFSSNGKETLADAPPRARESKTVTDGNSARRGHDSAARTNPAKQPRKPRS